MKSNCWTKILTLLSEDYDNETYKVWFEPLEYLREDEGFVYLLSHSKFNSTVIDKRNYRKNFAEYYKKIYGEDKMFIVLDDFNDINIKENIKKEEIKNIENDSNLNDDYNFENFVVGTKNQLAHAAGIAVSKNPGEKYNPLFIYGGVGLGKTHLMHAIGNYIQSERPNSIIKYVSSENYTNDFIDSIKDNKTDVFRKKYRDIDVLLIDDIQFLSDKDQTQEAFFNNFNQLHLNNKQIVISSDRPPNEIHSIEERLRSRFAMGLTTDIKTPDFETRVAILKKKAENDKDNIEQEVFEYIASNIKSNIRELEGALTRVLAYASLVEQEINEELCIEALKGIINEEKIKKIDSTHIRKIVSSYFNVTIEELDSPKRNKDISYPRQVAMYLIRTITDLSLPRIGTIFGGRDHSTVLHAYNKINKEIDIYIETKEMIDRLIEQINN